jgi:hypothetical protein
MISAAKKSASRGAIAGAKAVQHRAVLQRCRELCGAARATESSPRLLLAESREEVAVAIARAARDAGFDVAVAPTLAALQPLVRATGPTAVMVHLGFDGRAGAAAAATLRSMVPQAVLVEYADPTDVSLVLVAEALGLGPFVVY